MAVTFSRAAVPAGELKRTCADRGWHGGYGLNQGPVPGTSAGTGRRRRATNRGDVTQRSRCSARDAGADGGAGIAPRPRLDMGTAWRGHWRRDVQDAVPLRSVRGGARQRLGDVRAHPRVGAVPASSRALTLGSLGSGRMSRRQALCVPHPCRRCAGDCSSSSGLLHHADVECPRRHGRLRARTCARSPDSTVGVVRRG